MQYALHDGRSAVSLGGNAWFGCSCLLQLISSSAQVSFRLKPLPTDRVTRSLATGYLLLFLGVSGNQS
jgi:hypothetical protein